MRFFYARPSTAIVGVWRLLAGRSNSLRAAESSRPASGPHHLTPAELHKKAARLTTIADSVTSELSEDPGMSPGEHHFLRAGNAKREGRPGEAARASAGCQRQNQGPHGVVQ